MESLLSNFFQNVDVSIFGVKLFISFIPPQCKDRQHLRKINLFKQRHTCNIALWLAGSAFAAHGITTMHLIHFFIQINPQSNVLQTTVFLLWLRQFPSSVTDFTVKKKKQQPEKHKCHNL